MVSFLGINISILNKKLGNFSNFPFFRIRKPKNLLTKFYEVHFIKNAEPKLNM